MTTSPPPNLLDLPPDLHPLGRLAHLRHLADVGAQLGPDLGVMNSRTF